MSLIRLNNQAVTNITSLPALTSVPSAALSEAGQILQVQYTQFDGINDVTVGGSNEVEFSDLSVNITPRSTNSIILLQAQVMGEFASRNLNWNGVWYFRRDTTSLRHPSAGLGGRPCGIAIGYISHEADANSTPEGVTYSYYDTTHNTTSQVTYKVTFFSANTAANYNLNHCLSDQNNSSYERLVSFISATEIAGGQPTSVTYTVTVVGSNPSNHPYYNVGSTNKYAINGSTATADVLLNLTEGSTYTFDQSDSSNAGHPLRFSTTANGTHGGGSEYTTGVTTNGTPGSAGAYTRITVATGAPTLYYYCTNHSAMGWQANTP